MNIYEFAKKMELDGKAYYEQLAGDTTNASLKELFLGLAQDEQKHYQTIQRLSESGEVAMVDSTVLENAQNLFQMLLSDTRNVVDQSKELAVYQHAMTIEAQSVKFYTDTAQKEENPEAARLLLKIAEEEKKHFVIMDNLYSFMLAPHNYLAWGEFSNLAEYY